MKSKKIICGIHYIKPVHKQKFFINKVNYGLTNTEKVCKQIVSLPIYPGLTSQEQKYIINIINKY